MRFPKSPRLEDEKYLAYIRTLPCKVCGQAAEPHHTEGGGTALIGSDYQAIPLCRDHHQEHNHLGKTSFYVKHNLGMEREIIKCLEGYLVECDVSQLRATIADQKKRIARLEKMVVNTGSALEVPVEQNA